MLPGIEIRIGGDTSQLEAAETKANRAFDGIAQKASQAGASASGSMGRSFSAIEAAAQRLAMKSSTAMGNLGNAFTGAGQGSVKMSSTVQTALDNMATGTAQDAARAGQALDALVQKYQEFGRATAVIPANLPGLGGASFGPDPFRPVVDSADKADKSVKNLKVNMGGIAAQFNDIGVTAAMGMSPMMIALQQGTQLSQAFAGQRLGDTARGIGAAFMSMVSPVSLATIGLTAAVAVAAQWAMAAIAGGKETKTFAEALDDAGKEIDALRSYADSALSPLDDLEKKFGANAEKAREVYTALAALQSIKAIDELATAMSSAGDELEGLENRLLRIDQVAGTGQGAAVMARQVRLIREEYGLTEQQARLVLQRMEEMGQATGPYEMAVAAGNLANALADARDESGKIPPNIRNLAIQLLEASRRGLSLEDAVLDAKDAADKLAASGPGDGWLSSAIGAASTLATKLWEAAQARAAAEGSEWQPVPEGGVPNGGKPPPRAPAELGIPEPKTGGGGKKTNPLADRLERLQESLMTERELVAQWYAESQMTLEEALAAKMLTEAEYMTERERLEQEHQDRLKGIRDASNQSAIGAVLQTGQEILAAMGNTNSKALRAAQAFGAGVALINAYTAASEALKDPRLPWFARVAAAGKVLAAGIGFVNAIKGINASANGVTGGAAGGAAAATQGPGQTISIAYDGPDFARQPIEAVVGQLNDFIKRGGRIDGVMMT